MRRTLNDNMHIENNADNEHEFSSYYLHRKDMLLSGLKDMEDIYDSDLHNCDQVSKVKRNIHDSGRFVKVAVILICAVILVPVSVQAAISLYRFTVRRQGIDVEGTISVSTEMSPNSDGANKDMAAGKESGDSSYEDRYINLEFDYLPYKLEKQEENKYDVAYGDGSRGISIWACAWDGTDYSFYRKKVESSETMEAGAYEFLLLSRGDVNAVYDKVIYIPMEDKKLILTIFFGRDITRTELVSFVAGMHVKEVFGDPTAESIHVNNQDFLDDTISDEDITRVSYSFADIRENFYAYGCVVQVSDVRVYDNISCIGKDNAVYWYKKGLDDMLVDADGVFKYVDCRMLIKGDDNQFSSWGDELPERLCLVAVDVTYESAIEKNGSGYMNISVQKGKKNGTDGFSELKEECYIDDCLVPITFHAPAYIESDGEKMSYCDTSYKAALDGQEHKAIFYFLVAEGELDDTFMVFTSSYGNKYENTAIKLFSGSK